MAARSRGLRPVLGFIALVLLAIPGFGLGVVAGVAWEDPGLLLGHLLGRSVEVPWGSVARSEAAPQSEATPERAAAAPPARVPEKELPAVAAPAPASTTRATRLRTEVLTPGSGPRFAVQVGAFSESRAAEALAESLRAEGFDAYVSPSPKPAAARWRVRVGPFASRENAEGVAARLKVEQKLPTWVLDENAV